MDRVFGNLPGTVVYIHDILIKVSDESELLDRVVVIEEIYKPSKIYKLPSSSALRQFTSKSSHLRGIVYLKRMQGKKS